MALQLAIILDAALQFGALLRATHIRHHQARPYATYRAFRRIPRSAIKPMPATTRTRVKRYGQLEQGSQRNMFFNFQATRTGARLAP